MFKKWVIVLKIKVLDILWLEILDSSLHVMIVLKAQFESDDFTFVRIWAIHHLNHLVCFAPLIACTIALAWLLLILLASHPCWEMIYAFCSYKPLAKWAYLELIPLIALLSLVSLSLFWSSLQALSEKPWYHHILKEFWSFGIVLGISVGGFCFIG